MFLKKTAIITLSTLFLTIGCVSTSKNNDVEQAVKATILEQANKITNLESALIESKTDIEQKQTALQAAKTDLEKTQREKEGLINS